MMGHHTVSYFRIFLFLIFVFAGGQAFFLDSSTPAANGGDQYLTYRHFMQIMDMLYEEKQARHQLEQTVSVLQGKLDSFNQNCHGHIVNVSEFKQPYITRLQNQENELALLRKTYDNSLRTKENELAILRGKVTQLEQNYTSIIHDTENLKTENQMFVKEVAALKVVKDLAVADKLQETSNELNLLKVNSQARSQDFLALYNLTMSCRAEINDGLNKLTNADKIVENKFIDMENKILEIQHGQNVSETRLTQVVHNATAMTEKIGFTACFALIEGQIIKFTDVKYVNGIVMSSSYRNGTFYATENGFYFVTANVLIRDLQGFYIYHNNNLISFAWSHHLGSTNGYHSASTSAFLKLKIGDTVSVKPVPSMTIDPTSCLTIFKF